MASSSHDRIIILIDMDCFFCQVETKLQPEYAGKPLAVVQYYQWQLGGIIAVNYEAREYGVTRHMRGGEAKEKCPGLILASVPCLRDKADTSRYRRAGREVIDVIRKHCSIVERASVDEAYLDITDIVEKKISDPVSTEDLITQLSNTFVVGYSDIGTNDEEERSRGMRTWVADSFEELEDIQAQKLAVAGVIVEELRSDIFEKTGFRCSAGIAQNKILAKLACGLHKPNRQTILPASAVSTLYSTLPVKKVRNLGGKFGDVVVESLNCNVMGDLLQYSLQYLQKRFDDKTGLWLYNIARGVDNEPVTVRFVTKSIGACKKFPGKQAITSLDVLKHWADDLSAEVCDRLEQDLEENERRATLLTICYQYYQNKTIVSQSRSCTLTSYKPEKMANRCVEIVSRSTQRPIAYLGISTGKFIQAKGSENFRNFFKSTKLELGQEADDRTENKYTQSASRVIEKVADNLKINATTNMICNNADIKNVPNSKVRDVAQNSKSSVQLSERISNAQTDWSPTSRKLNSLITSLNERNKIKAFSEKRMNNSHLNDPLDQNEFKESFFVNIFNSKETKSRDAYTREAALIEIDENENTKRVTENDYTISRDELYVNEEDSNNARDSDELHVVEEQCNNKESISNEVEHGQSSSSATRDRNDETINLRNTVKLQDIFPDLNDIDASVVALLPPELQEEAKLYMKVQSRKTSTKEIVVKNSKVKSKSKSNVTKGKKNNGIYSFLVRKDSTNFIQEPSKKCLQCYQMIPISKYDEHCDFHVAENLQRELNNPALQGVNVKRKVSTCDIDTNSMKRRPNLDVLKLDTNGTSSFLS